MNQQTRFTKITIQYSLKHNYLKAMPFSLFTWPLSSNSYINKEPSMDLASPAALSARSAACTLVPGLRSSTVLLMVHWQTPAIPIVLNWRRKKRIDFLAGDGGYECPNDTSSCSQRPPVNSALYVACSLLSLFLCSAFLSNYSALARCSRRL